MKFGQNMHKIHADAKKKTTGRCDFQVQRYWIFKIFSSQKSHLANCLFFLVKKLSKHTILVSGQQNFARTSQRASHTNKKNIMMLSLIWRRLQWKYFQGSVYVARTVPAVNQYERRQNCPAASANMWQFSKQHCISIYRNNNERHIEKF